MQNAYVLMYYCLFRKYFFKFVVLLFLILTWKIRLRSKFKTNRMNLLSLYLNTFYETCNTTIDYDLYLLNQNHITICAWKSETKICIDFRDYYKLESSLRVRDKTCAWLERVKNKLNIQLFKSYLGCMLLMDGNFEWIRLQFQMTTEFENVRYFFQSR